MSYYELSDSFNELFNEMGPVDSEVATILSILVVWILIVGIICLIAIIFNVVARWIFFNKCGEAGWKALIPVYDEITLLKVSGLNWWWIFLIYASSIYSLLQSMIGLSTIGYQSVGLGMLSMLLSFFSFFVSIATILAKVNECNNLAKKFNKGAGHAALIFFFEPIMFLIMGLSKEYVYDKNLSVPKNGFFGE